MTTQSMEMREFQSQGSHISINNMKITLLAMEFQLFLLYILLVWIPGWCRQLSEIHQAAWRGKGTENKACPNTEVRPGSFPY